MKNTYNPRRERYEKIYYLLQVLYKYYPIGVESMSNEFYPGFKELERIGQEKFSLACDEKLEPWLTMIKDIRNKSRFKVLDYTGTTAPFLDGCIELKEQENESLYFNFQISLLGPYYTYFYRLHRYAKKPNEVLPIDLGYTVYRNHQYLLEKEPNIDVDIDDLIKKYYPNLEFFEHDFLMNYHIKQATPYTTSNDIHIKEDRVPIYDFFFDMYCRVNTLILN